MDLLKLEQDYTPRLKKRIQFFYSEVKGLEISLNEKKREKVTLHPCFPWSKKAQFISVKNSKNDEVYLIEDIQNLEISCQKAVSLALFEAGFCFEIKKIISVESEFELRHWKVETISGPRIFQTELTDWPLELPQGGLLIQDLFGDQYVIHSPIELDSESQKLLWSFL